jgi:hypothetical protein
MVTQFWAAPAIQSSSIGLNSNVTGRLAVDEFRSLSRIDIASLLTELVSNVSLGFQVKFPFKASIRGRVLAEGIKKDDLKQAKKLASSRERVGMLRLWSLVATTPFDCTTFGPMLSSCGIRALDISANWITFISE